MLLFFFQAEDGIRDIGVTGVQTCALPIWRRTRRRPQRPREASRARGGAPVGQPEQATTGKGSGEGRRRRGPRRRRGGGGRAAADRESTRLNSRHANISYAVFCLKKKKTHSTRCASSSITITRYP